MRTIIFAGYFSVGEKITKTQHAAVAHAKTLEGDIAVLVNDIDLSRKIRFYTVGGRDMLIHHYSKRIKCGGTQQLCELPSYQTLPQIIDWGFYADAVHTLNDSGGDITQTFLNELLSRAIEQRLEEYQLDRKSIILMTEKELRNRAGKRISNTEKNSKRGWRKQLEALDILREVQTAHNTIPTCGGIMLAQFEKCTQAGYDTIIQLDGEEERRAIENGIRLFTMLHERFPSDPRWQASFETAYL